METSTYPKTITLPDKENPQSVSRKRIIARVSVMVIYMGFFGLIFLFFWMLKRMKIRDFSVCAVIMVIQKLLCKRNFAFIDWGKKYLYPHYFFRKYEIIYDAEVPSEGVMFA